MDFALFDIQRILHRNLLFISLTILYQRKNDVIGSEKSNFILS